MSQVECLNCENKFIYNEDDEMPELCEKCKDLWECDNCGTYVNENDINECKECGNSFCEGCMENHNGSFEDEEYEEDESQKEYKLHEGDKCMWNECTKDATKCTKYSYSTYCDDHWNQMVFH